MAVREILWQIQGMAEETEFGGTDVDLTYPHRYSSIEAFSMIVTPHIVPSKIPVFAGLARADSILFLVLPGFDRHLMINTGGEDGVH
jgi:hypothetical protein